jgi:outer membrane receptor protein involved in Fe transport
MAGRTALAALALAALAFSPPARADQRPSPVDIRAGSLSSALQDLARQTGIELLYDRSMIRGARSPAVRGRLTGEAALRQLLGGSGLSMRRSASGAWLIERRRPADSPAPPELEAPEILVIGNRTQNFDIRRREDDIQPYQVATGAQLIRAHRDNIDQYFRSRVTANTQIAAPGQLAFGETNSAIDLRGLGTEGTLVLIDGRRMPRIPRSTLDFGQPDLNAIPLHAVERIETLTGTAGGIYGFGALGGVVNVVLQRDYRGLDLHATGGISTRGDARRLSLEARLGFTPDGGGTDVMLYASRAWSQPLLEGQRGFIQRANELSFGFVPQIVALNLLNYNAVTVVSFLGDDLVLKPEYGGTSLGSTFTYLPIGFAGTPAELVASLTGNAGRLNLEPDDSTARSGLGSNPSVFSLIATVRHRFGADVEAYLDAIVLRNRGRHIDHVNDGVAVLLPDDPRNPFNNYAWTTFPVDGADGGNRARFDSERYTAGLISPLPFGWRATAEATFGRVSAGLQGGLNGFYNGPLIPDGTEGPDFNPFGNWAAFQQAQTRFLFDKQARQDSYNRYQEQSLRVAGPVFGTAAGVGTLTMLAERRRERVPAFDLLSTNNLFGGVTTTNLSSTASRTSTTRSLYAELRVPLLSDETAVPLLRGLDLQLAFRRDVQNVDFARNPDEPDTSERISAHFASNAFTAGARIFPLPWLMLRGSFATGRQPPPLAQLVTVELSLSTILLADPKRGGAIFLNDDQYLLLLGGSPDLTTIRATTLSLGMVLNPAGAGGPRISLDYSRIRRTRDVYSLTGDLVLANEERLPGRVVRDPLTDADRALGYTGGRITTIDATPINAGRLLVESIDGRVDWPFPFRGGTLRLSGAATLQRRHVRSSPFDADLELVGYRSGPLRWRANGGGEWTTGRTTIGANLQYFNRYRLLPDPSFQIIEDFIIRAQGSRRVHAQMYLDLYASRRFPLHGPGGDQQLVLDLGIVNLFDRRPPYESNVEFSGSRYSFYGDARGRRIELGLSASF